MVELVGDLQDERVVGGDQDRRAPTGLRPQEGDEMTGGLLVKGGGGLVQAQQPRGADQGPGHGGPLTLTAGERGRVLVQDLVEVELLSQVDGPLPEAGPHGAGGTAWWAAQEDVPQDTQPGQDGTVLPGVAQEPGPGGGDPLGPAPGHRLPGPGDATGTGLEEPGHDPQQAGLPAAGATGQAGHRSCAQDQVVGADHRTGGAPGDVRDGNTLQGGDDVARGGRPVCDVALTTCTTGDPP